MQICANLFISWKFITRHPLHPQAHTATHTGRQSQPKLKMLPNDHRSLSLSLCMRLSSFEAAMPGFHLECSCHNLWQLSAFMWQARKGRCIPYFSVTSAPSIATTCLNQLWRIWFAGWVQQLPGCGLSHSYCSSSISKFHSYPWPGQQQQL